MVALCVDCLSAARNELAAVWVPPAFSSFVANANPKPQRHVAHAAHGSVASPLRDN